jgi:archaeal type IV pilus assembly protein PilA
MTKSKEDAVSPVIGVILMVAVTVILAAVIAAFVFGMGSNVSKTKIVAATAQQSDATSGYVTYQGGQDAAQVTYLGVTAPGVTANTSMGITVGSTYALTALSGAKDHVVVQAVFSDGGQQVILDTYI